jgi:hypothetical protein
MLIGAHVSPAGGPAKAVERGAEVGARSIQIFNQNPRAWKPTVYSDEQVGAFREAMAGSDVDALLIHAVYLLNAASEDADIRKKTLVSLTTSLQAGDALGAHAVVLHAGSAKAGDVAEAISRAGEDPWSPIMLARTLLPLVQVPPAGCWRERGRPRFVVDPRKPPAADRAAEHVLRRYLAAFGPASRRDLAAWAGVPQREFAAALHRAGPVVHHDEAGGELLDLPGLELPPASTALPVRLLARWDQALLAHADRRRIIPAELEELRLTLSGDQTVTVDGRVAASWRLRRGRAVAEVAVQPHVELRRRDLPRIRAEARRTARFCEPDAAKVAVSGV